MGQPAGEGAAYRVDLRLRPHGRDGALACSLNEVIRYYRENAQAWELQALIRARAAAGSAHCSPLCQSRASAGFSPGCIGQRSPGQCAPGKTKDRQAHRANSGGFNVKLNRGGIREIEFIAQALQLAHGGNDEWLRVAHTLISLGRLAEET